MGGAGSALVILMIDGMGRGWCFTFVALVLLLLTPILLVLQKSGPRWRKARMVQGEMKVNGRRASTPRAPLTSV